MFVSFSFFSTKLIKINLIYSVNCQFEIQMHYENQAPGGLFLDTITKVNFIAS